MQTLLDTGVKLLPKIQFCMCMQRLVKICSIVISSACCVFSVQAKNTEVHIKSFSVPSRGKFISIQFNLYQCWPETKYRCVRLTRGSAKYNEQCRNVPSSKLASQIHLIFTCRKEKSSATQGLKTELAKERCDLRKRDVCSSCVDKTFKALRLNQNFPTFPFLTFYPVHLTSS